MAVIYICAGQVYFVWQQKSLLLSLGMELLADDSAIMRLPFIGFSFWVIGHRAAGVIRKQAGEVDTERRGSAAGGREGDGDY